MHSIFFHGLSMDYQQKSLSIFIERLSFGGRYWARTSDPLLVRQMLWTNWAKRPFFLIVVTGYNGAKLQLFFDSPNNFMPVKINNNLKSWLLRWKNYKSSLKSFFFTYFRSCKTDAFTFIVKFQLVLGPIGIQLKRISQQCKSLYISIDVYESSLFLKS